MASMLIVTLLLTGCGQQEDAEVDRLNEAAYAYHYRNLDSTRYYAEAALQASTHYRDGRAEALNNLAFVDIVKMNYEQANNRLN